MVLAAQFGSFLQPIVIMLAMPLSAIGALVGLRLVGENFSVLAFIGLLMLMGMVVKNSILMVDFTNTLRAAGMDKHPALIRASAIRLRPILMTSLAVVLGNLPSVIGLGAGAELRRGLATVVAGGMVASTLLALVLIPVAYSLMDSATTRVGRLFRRKESPAAATVLPATSGDAA
jgi:hydrophobic/amphiphilic exporter-1 (mainly G- bacteria), HAE1 family